MKKQIAILILLIASFGIVSVEAKADSGVITGDAATQSQPPVGWSWSQWIAWLLLNGIRL